MDNSILKETEEILVRLFTEREYLNQVSSTGGLPQYQNYSFDRRGASIYAAVLQTNRLATMKSIYPRTARVLADHFEGSITNYGLILHELVKSSPAGANTFLLNHLGSYFPEYFQARESRLASEYPYLQTLIQFEAATAELVDMAENTEAEKEKTVSASPRQDLLKVNPCHKIFRFQYDIAEIIEAVDTCKNPSSLSFQPKNVVTLMLRNPRSYKIRLLEINSLTALLIEHAAGRKTSLEDLTAIAQDHCLLPAESLNKHLMALVEELRNEFVFI